MNRAAFLKRLGLGALATLVAREATATTDRAPGAPDTADAVPAEPSLSSSYDVVPDARYGDDWDRWATAVSRRDRILVTRVVD